MSGAAGTGIRLRFEGCGLPSTTALPDGFLDLLKLMLLELEILVFFQTDISQDEVVSKGDLRMLQDRPVRTPDTAR